MSRRDWIIYILLTLVFLSSWTDINGIYAELPQIVLIQPESWKLGAYVALVTSFGNIAPLIFVLIRCFRKNITIDPVPTNYVIILVGMFSCFLLIFFWSYTTNIGGEQRSTALLILAFFLSILDCTSSVSFADYINRFRKEFLNCWFLGESLTLVLPSLLAIVQGNGEVKCLIHNGTINAFYRPARFSISIYFLCLFILLTISFVAFVLLQWTKLVPQTEQIQVEVSTIVEPLSKTIFFLFCLTSVYTSGIIFGLLLSISTYVLMPYGHRIFYLGTILSPWMLTFVWLIGMKISLIAKRYLILHLVLGTITFLLELIVALKSPCSPGIDSLAGNVIILIIWLSTYFFIGYPRLVIANYLRIYSSNGLFWFGVSVQLGALFGSILAYVLVETFALFRERAACEIIVC